MSDDQSNGGAKNLYVIVAMLSIIAALQSITDSQIGSVKSELQIQISAHDKQIDKNNKDLREWLRRLRDLLDGHITDPKIHYAGMAATNARLEVLERELARIDAEQRRRRGE